MHCGTPAGGLPAAKGGPLPALVPTLSSNIEEAEQCTFAPRLTRGGYAPTRPQMPAAFEREVIRMRWAEHVRRDKGTKALADAAWLGMEHDQEELLKTSVKGAGGRSGVADAERQALKALKTQQQRQAAAAAAAVAEVQTRLEKAALPAEQRERLDGAA